MKKDVQKCIEIYKEQLNQVTKCVQRKKCFISL